MAYNVTKFYLCVMDSSPKKWQAMRRAGKLAQALARFLAAWHAWLLLAPMSTLS